MGRESQEEFDDADILEQLEDDDKDDDENEELSDDFDLEGESTNFSSLTKYYEKAAGANTLDKLLIMFCYYFNILIEEHALFMEIALFHRFGEDLRTVQRI